MPGKPNGISLMERDQAAQVAGIHERVLHDSIYTQLGRAFLEYYYTRLLDNPDFLCHVYTIDGKVTGFLASTSAASHVFLRQIVRDPVRLIRTIGKAVVRDPAKLVILASAAKFLLADRPRFPVTADGEVLSLAVLPEYRATELRADGGVRPTEFFERHRAFVAGELFDAAVSALAARGVRDIKVMTGSNNRASNRFYEKVGCRLAAEGYPIFGEPSNLYYARLADLAPTVRSRQPA